PMSAEMNERLQGNPSQFIEQEITEFVHTSPANHLPFMNDYVMWDKPLVKFADGDGSIFSEYKVIIAPTHFTPREALAKAHNKSLEDMLARLSVISWLLPATEETRKSNCAEPQVPSRLWSHTRWYGEKFNAKLRTHVVDPLNDMGYLAVAPFSESYFKVYANEKSHYSNGLIPESGIAHRCGSVVTSK
ncbi:hypothetical protein ACFLTR_04440, partial [Chloroflexota bacterium]